MGFIIIRQSTYGIEYHTRKHLWNSISYEDTLMELNIMRGNSYGIGCHTRKHLWESIYGREDFAEWDIIRGDTYGIEYHTRKHLYERTRSTTSLNISQWTALNGSFQGSSRGGKTTLTLPPQHCSMPELT